MTLPPSPTNAAGGWGAPAPPMGAVPQPAWGGPARPQPSRVLSAAAPVVYAGFWIRFVGVMLDGIVTGLVLTPVQFLVNLGGGALVSATATCEQYQRGQFLYRECSPVAGLVWMIIIVQLIVTITVWWFFIPRRMAQRGATVGMKAVGIKIVTASHHTLISSGQALVRILVQPFLQIAMVLPSALAVLFGLDVVRRIRDGEDLFYGVEVPGLWIGLMVFGYLSMFIPHLWNVVDRRRQTLFDKVAGTVVVRR